MRYPAKVEAFRQFFPAGLVLVAWSIASADTFVVVNTNDSGAGSLREAMDAANANLGPDTIEFKIPGDGPHTIQPNSELPEITDSVVIDGYTQSGASPNTNPPGMGKNTVLKIELDGSNAGDFALGLFISTDDCTIRGLVINRFLVGIGVGFGGSHNTVEGSFVGTDVSGTVDLGSLVAGVGIIDAPNNTIGGSQAGAGNVISGNDGFGILIDGSSAPLGTSGNVVQGNFIGTDVTGRSELGNELLGVAISEAHSNTIGGPESGAGNVISGNLCWGIFISGSGASGNTVEGNFIGTDVTGTVDLGNGCQGTEIEDAPRNTIGGSQEGARNVISGNGEEGILIRGSGASGNEIMGNFIGTDVTGTLDFGNSFEGVEIKGGAQSNIIGGSTAGDRNIISGNGSHGVRIGDTGTDNNVVRGNNIGSDVNGSGGIGNAFSGVIVHDGASMNSIRGNSIFANLSLGIDLGEDGVTSNDSADADSGPNKLQNYPVISLFETGATRVAGTLDSLPNTTFEIDFFVNSAADPSGFGEGERFLGPTSVTTDSFGDASFDVAISIETTAGEFATATATDPNGNTSEFSASIEGVPMRAQATMLHVSFADPIGDHSAFGPVQIDVVELKLEFDNATGAYEITFTADAANPFIGDFRLNANLVNGDITPFTQVPSTLFDNSNRFSLDNPTSTIVLTGVNSNLLSWKTGDRVATSDGPFGVPIDATFSGFRSGVSGEDSFPRGPLDFATIIGVFTVNSADDVDDGAGDIGHCSLREAINAANANPRPDTIAFEIAGPGPHTIQPITGLPEITDAVIIDGFTQSGASQNTNPPGLSSNAVLKIELDGTNAGAANGLFITVADCSVQGLVINRFGLSGIYILGADSSGNVLQGNFIGTDVTGTVDLGNGLAGVEIFDAPNNTVGGSQAGEGNVISGNDSHGIDVQSSGHLIQGNFIGTDVTGTADLGNFLDGVLLGNASNTTVGGATLAARNIISANGRFGVDIASIATGNLVQENFIGTDVTGTTALGNVEGVSIAGSNNTVANNVISGNDLSGVHIQGFTIEGGTTGNIVRGNFIGTDAAGTSALGNGWHGVFFRIGSIPGFIPINNTIGGTSDGDGNVIAFNGRDGVFLASNGGTGNAILGNAIFSNTGLGIDLDPDSITPNDAGDDDTGPNNRQNFPVISLFETGATRIVGTLNSEANTTFEIDFFANAAADPSGFGEGERFLGATTVTTDSFGDASFDVAIPIESTAGEFATATATDPNGSTSEFSAGMEGVLSGVALTFDDWKSGTFDPDDLANEAIVGTLADPDQDGIPNLLEFALSRDPLSPDDPMGSVPEVTTEEDFLTVTFRRVSNLSDIRYALEVSDDLVDWETVDLVGRILAVDGSVQTVEVKVPIESATKKFIRLMVSEN